MSEETRDPRITMTSLQRVLVPIMTELGKVFGAHGRRVEALEAKLASITPRVDRSEQQQSATNSRLAALERALAELKKAQR